jgi:hypothetical protein
MRGALILLIVAAAVASIVAGGAQSVAQAVSVLGPEFANLRADVREAARAVLDAANAEFASDGLRVGLYEGWRPIGVQESRIAAGASLVADPTDSLHVWGLAVDFVFLDQLGRWTWLPDPADPANTAYRDPRWYRLGQLIERAGLVWGGRWAWFDGPHAQAPGVSVASLRSVYGSPDAYLATFEVA